MSPWLTEEQSEESGRPIELFRITLGSTIFRYTSAAEDITADGQTWAAIPKLKRDNFTLGPDDRNQTKDFALPGDNQFAANYILSAPSEVPTIEVFQVHFGDASDVQDLWQGEIIDVVWLDNTSVVKLTARPVEGGMDAEVPRHDAGLLCGAMLYDAECGVAESAFDFAGTASGVSGNTLVVSGIDVAANFTPPAAKSGKIRVDSSGEVRMIVGHTATDTLEIASPFKDDPIGEAVTVMRGCDRTAATCNSVFVNIANFRGRPHLPTRDPNESFR